MKTRFLRLGKSSISLALSVLMIISTVLVGSSVTVESTADDETIITNLTDIVDDMSTIDADDDNVEINSKSDEDMEIINQVDDKDINDGLTETKSTVVSTNTKKGVKSVPNSSGDSYTYYFDELYEWNCLSIYSWGGDSSTSWPGDNMAYDPQLGLYYQTFTSQPTGFIFNNNKNNTSSNTNDDRQTGDIQETNRVNNNVYVFTNNKEMTSNNIKGDATAYSKSKEYYLDDSKLYTVYFPLPILLIMFECILGMRLQRLNITDYGILLL